MRPGKPRNPYSAARVAPGALDYIFAGGETVGALADDLARAGWRAELVGCHGAGKSTLMAALIREAEARGMETAHLRCGAGRSWLPRGWFRAVRSADVVFVDGAERLAPHGWVMLRGVAYLGGKGLVLTLHESRGFGHSRLVSADELCLARVVRSLSGGYEDSQEVGSLLRRHKGNAREVLFSLYDRFETGS